MKSVKKKADWHLYVNLNWNFSSSLYLDLNQVRLSTSEGSVRDPRSLTLKRPRVIAPPARMDLIQVYLALSAYRLIMLPKISPE